MHGPMPQLQFFGYEHILILQRPIQVIHCIERKAHAHNAQSLTTYINFEIASMRSTKRNTHVTEKKKKKNQRRAILM
jgi:hypothetical protein